MEENGRWVTIMGRHVFIENGKSLNEAMKESGKFDSNEFRNESFKEAPKHDDIKSQQFKIIQENNPMLDEYHTGIRRPEDIKTWEEALEDEESFVWGDFSKEEGQEALKKGEIRVYSSYDIGQGTFVSTSKNQAMDYAGGGKVYEKIVPITDVAWINGDEGQYAKRD